MKLDTKMKVKLLVLGVSGALFLLLTVMVQSYDVAAIGPMDTEIGFSQLNGSVHDTLGTNLFWYDLTEVFGFLALAVCGLFVAVENAPDEIKAAADYITLSNEEDGVEAAIRKFVL